MVPSGLKVYESVNTEQMQETEKNYQPLKKKKMFPQTEPNSTL